MNIKIITARFLLFQGLQNIALIALLFSALISFGFYHFSGDKYAELIFPLLVILVFSVFSALILQVLKSYGYKKTTVDIVFIEKIFWNTQSDESKKNLNIKDLEYLGNAITYHNSILNIDRKSAFLIGKQKSEFIEIINKKQSLLLADPNDFLQFFQ